MKTMTVAASTFVDKVLYSRIISVQESVHDALKQQIMDSGPEFSYDWTNMKITREEFDESGRRCEDRLRITIEVEIL